MRIEVGFLLYLLATPGASQEHPFDRFIGEYEVVETTMPAPDAEIVYSSVAGGLGIHSVWIHGTGESFYEAQALWGHTSEGQVRVLEVNSVGVVAVHVGGFDESGALTVRRYADDGTTVLELRTFSWADADTLEMTAEFQNGGRTVHHRVVLARK